MIEKLSKFTGSRFLLVFWMTWAFLIFGFHTLGAPYALHPVMLVILGFTFSAWFVTAWWTYRMALLKEFDLG